MDYGKDLEQLFEELGADKLEQEPPRTVLEPEMLEDEEPINEYETENVDVTDDDAPMSARDRDAIRLSAGKPEYQRPLGLARPHCRYHRHFCSNRCRGLDENRR